jgi:hypothetical protein
MKCNLVGAFIRNAKFGTEVAFVKGLRKIGVEVNTIDPAYPNQTFDYGADFTLVFKFLDKYLDEFMKCKNRVIYQPDDYRYPFIKKDMGTMRKYCDYALTYDSEAAENCKNDWGYLASERMLLTADNEVYKPIPGLAKEYDFCFVGNLSHPENHKSRRRMLELLGEAGYNVVYADHFFDIPKIVEMYNKSKIILNHATDLGQPFGYGWGYQSRHFEAGFTKSFILTNWIYDDIEDETGPSLWMGQFDSEKELLEMANHYIKWEKYHGEQLTSDAQRLYDNLYKYHLPEHRAQQLVEFVESNCNV